MNDKRIIDFVDSLFAGTKQTDNVLEQKEELQAHLAERITDYTSNGASFDKAFEMAKADIGDINELTAPFEKKESRYSNNPAEDEKPLAAKTPLEPAKRAWVLQGTNWKIAALSPFIFIALGFMFGWWEWAWVIIPVSGILFAAPIPWRFKLIALSPFVFVMLGFAFGWWAWAWMIIPVSGILLGTTGGKEKWTV